jgi:hypothetical protein
MPAFAPIALFLLLATCMVSWDGLVRRHARFAFRALSTDVHLRGIPAVSVGLVSLLLLVLSCAMTAQQLSMVSQLCDGGWGCVAASTLRSLTEDVVTILLVLGLLVYFGLWALGMREMQGPYIIMPLAPGVVFNEADIVRRVQAHLAQEGLDGIPSDTIVRAVSEIRARGGAVGLYKTQHLGMDPDYYQQEVIERFAHMPIETMARLKPRQRQVVIAEIVGYVRDVRIRGINAYPWNRRVPFA